MILFCFPSTKIRMLMCFLFGSGWSVFSEHVIEIMSHIKCYNFYNRSISSDLNSYKIEYSLKIWDTSKAKKSYYIGFVFLSLLGFWKYLACTLFTLGPGSVNPVTETPTGPGKITMTELNEGCNKSIQKQMRKREFEMKLVSEATAEVNRINFGVCRVCLILSPCCQVLLYGLII